jgi:excisionase family DNA binding protein
LSDPDGSYLSAESVILLQRYEVDIDDIDEPGMGREHMAAPRKEREYMTPGEVAVVLHVSPKTVNRWANEGRIPCIVTLGGHRRFHRDAVDAAAKQMTEARP